MKAVIGEFTLLFNTDVALVAQLRAEVAEDRAVVEQIRLEVEDIDQSFQEELADINLKHADVVLKHGEVEADRAEVAANKLIIEGIQTDVTDKQTDVTAKRDEVNATYTLVQASAAEVEADRISVAADKVQIDSTVAAFNTTAADALTDITTEGNTQTIRVRDEGDTQERRVMDEGIVTVNNVQDEGTKQQNEITTVSGNQQSIIINKGTEQVQIVEAKGDEQETRIEVQGNTQDTRIIAQGDTQFSRSSAEADRAGNEAATSSSHADRSKTEADRSDTQADRSTTEADRSALKASESETARDEAVAIVHDGEGSLVPGAGKYAVADSEGHIDKGWIKQLDNIDLVDNVTTVKGPSTFDGEVTVKDQTTFEDKINLPQNYGIASDDAFVVEGENSYGFTPKCSGNDGYLPIDKWTGKGDFEIECSVVYATVTNRDMLFDNVDISSISVGNCWGIHRRGTDSTSPNKIDVQWFSDDLDSSITISSGFVPADSGILHKYNLIRVGNKIYFYDNGVLIGIDSIALLSSYSIDTLLTGYNRDSQYDLKGQMYYFKMTDHSNPKNSRHYDFVKQQLTVPADSELLIPDLLDTGVYRFTPHYNGTSTQGIFPLWSAINGIIEFHVDLRGSGNEAQLLADNKDDYGAVVWNNDSTINIGSRLGRSVYIDNELMTFNNNTITTNKLNFTMRLEDINLGSQGLLQIGSIWAGNGRYLKGQIDYLKLINLDTPTNSRYYDFTRTATVAPGDDVLVVEEGELIIDETLSSVTDATNWTQLYNWIMPEIGLYELDFDIIDVSSIVYLYHESGQVNYSSAGNHKLIFNTQYSPPANEGEKYRFTFDVAGASDNKNTASIRTNSFKKIGTQLVDNTDYRNSINSHNSITINSDNIQFNNSDRFNQASILNSAFPSGSMLKILVNMTSITSGIFAVVMQASDESGSLTYSPIVSPISEEGIYTGEITIPNGLKSDRIYFDVLDSGGSTGIMEDISITVSYPCTLTGFSSPVWEKKVGETGPGVLTNFPVTQEVDQGDYRNSFVSSDSVTTFINHNFIEFINANGGGDYARITKTIPTGSEVTVSINVTSIISGEININGSSQIILSVINSPGVYSNSIISNSTWEELDIDSSIDNTTAIIKDISILVRRPGNTDPVWEQVYPARVGKLLEISGSEMKYMGKDLQTVPVPLEAIDDAIAGQEVDKINSILLVLREQGLIV